MAPDDNPALPFPPRVTSSPPPRILVIDDDAPNVRLLIDALCEWGFEPMVALNGEDGLLSAREGRPALILLDLMMPGMDGFGVCARLKANPKTRSIPVIVLSAFDESDAKLRAFSLGAVDFIPKPFDRREVLARVVRQLERDRQRQELEARLRALLQYAPADDGGWGVGATPTLLRLPGVGR